MVKEYFKKFSLSLHPEMITQIQEVAKRLQLTSASELFRQVWRDYYENEYRPKYLGYRGIDQGKAEKGPSMIDMVAKFEAMSDEEATQHLLDIKFYDEDELADKTFTITRDDMGARIRRMRYNNGSGGYDAPFSEVMIEYKKFIREFIKNNK